MAVELSEALIDFLSGVRCVMLQETGNASQASATHPSSAVSRIQLRRTQAETCLHGNNMGVHQPLGSSLLAERWMLMDVDRWQERGSYDEEQETSSQLPLP